MPEEAAAKGDADACFRLADWRFYGLYGPQDFERAYAPLGRAAALGHLPAARDRACLTASGIGCAEDFAAAVAMLEEIGSKDGRRRASSPCCRECCERAARPRRSGRCFRPNRGSS